MRNSPFIVFTASLLLSFGSGSLVHAADAADAPRLLLNRLAFGPAPGDLDRVQKLGVEAVIEAQLHPVAEPAALQQRLAALETTQRSAASLFAEFGPAARKAAKGDANEKKEYRDGIRRVVEQAEDARLLRAVMSPNQLQERLVDFWFSHFNVFSGKGLQGRLWVGPYEREAIRPYVFAHFRDLLGATAKHPAMLFYLDNWRSTAAGFKPRRGPDKGKEAGLNENYAREVMELHTLGVDGGYTQTDVTELARILTGWAFDPRAMAQGDRDAGFVFAERRHDHGVKHFLGETYRDEGQDEGEKALDRLAQHPATAHHIAFELAQYFVADVPPPALVDRISATFTKTHGDLRETTRALITSPEFLDANLVKFKTPYEYVVSTLRAAAVDTQNLRVSLGALRQLGQPIYGCATPDGWKNTQDAWLNPGAMLQRVNFATAVGTGRLPVLGAALEKVDIAAASDDSARDAMMQAAVGEASRRSDETRPQPIDVTSLEATLGLKLTGSTRGTIDQAPASLKSALLLGSPEFMQR